ncbi:MAG: DUF309 domain-containing protein [Deferrisomatales bacterium]|nr:DUF309 domain-containing protein [Deferrisomatales bacterium]
MVEATSLYGEALEKFREGRYYEAQQGFEALWHRAQGVERELYQGWVLVCASLFHRDRGNARGAAACLDRAEAHWSGLRTAPAGVEPRRVLEAVRAVVDREWVRPDLSEAEEAGPRDREGREEEW